MQQQVSSTSYPLIAVVIPTHNRRQYLLKLLGQLYSQRFGEYRVKIIVVDDGSSDGTAKALIDQFPEVYQITGNGDWWFTRSLNAGCLYAVDVLSADFVLTMNDDCEVGGDFIGNLLQVVKEYGKDCIAGAITLTISKPHKATFSGVRTITKWCLKSAPYLSPKKSVDINKLQGVFPTFSLMTRGMLVPRHIMVKLDYFDEKFVQYGSDDDFCLRAIEMSFKPFVSRHAIIYDHEGLTASGKPSSNPPLFEFVSSFFSRYSGNYLGKAMRFYNRHGYPFLLPLYFFIYIAGKSYAYFIKYRF